MVGTHVYVVSTAKLTDPVRNHKIQAANPVWIFKVPGVLVKLLRRCNQGRIVTAGICLGYISQYAVRTIKIQVYNPGTNAI